MASDGGSLSKVTRSILAFFSDNSPTVGWVKRLATRGSLAAIQLVQALALKFKTAGASLLTHLQISGEENALTDIPSHSFDSNLSWFCKNDTDLLKFSTKTPFVKLGLLGRLQTFQCSEYEGYFSAADAAF